MFFFVSSRRRHTICALVTGSSDVCSSDLIDVKFIAPPLFHFDEERAVFRAQRTARFTPEFRVIGDWQRIEMAVNDAEIILQRRRLHARIDRGEARSEERRVGKEGVSTLRSRWSTEH